MAADRIKPPDEIVLPLSEDEAQTVGKNEKTTGNIYFRYDVYDGPWPGHYQEDF